MDPSRFYGVNSVSAYVDPISAPPIGSVPTEIAANGTPDRGPHPGILILSDIGFIREALARVLTVDDRLSIVDLAADLSEARIACENGGIGIVLVDAAFPDGLDAIRRIRSFAPDARVVAFGVAETDENVIAWAEAGVSGYVPRSAGFAELVGALNGIMRGEQTCSARVAGGLLRRLAEHAQLANADPCADPLRLTRRELEFVDLLAEGLSNKDIARRLDIAVATAKSHVHNLLQKLKITRRSQVAARMRRHWRAAALSAGAAFDGTGRQGHPRSDEAAPSSAARPIVADRRRDGAIAIGDCAEI